MQVLLPLVFTSLASGAQRKASVQSEFNETLLLGKFRYSIRALAISTMQPRFNDTLHLFCNVSTYLLSSSKQHSSTRKTMILLKLIIFSIVIWQTILVSSIQVYLPTSYRRGHKKMVEQSLPFPCDQTPQYLQISAEA